MRTRLPISRDGAIATIVVTCVSLGLFLDSNASHAFQTLLGIVAWAMLIALLSGETRAVRMQVIVAVLFATIGEHFASPYLGAYIYRFENVPAYVPPGHGMVYLTALALGRSAFFNRFRWQVTSVALLLGTLWSLWGVTLAPRQDMAGAILFCVFALFVRFGRSPLLYVGAFFITSFLELVGTHFGTWVWALREPTMGLTQANPPSGIAAWYCLVDAVALTGGMLLDRALTAMRAAFARSPMGDATNAGKSHSEETV